MSSRRLISMRQETNSSSRIPRGMPKSPLNSLVSGRSPKTNNSVEWPDVVVRRLTDDSSLSTGSLSSASSLASDKPTTPTTRLGDRKTMPPISNERRKNELRVKTIFEDHGTQFLLTIPSFLVCVWILPQIVADHAHVLQNRVFVIVSINRWDIQRNSTPLYACSETRGRERQHTGGLTAHAFLPNRNRQNQSGNTAPQSGSGHGRVPGALHFWGRGDPWPCHVSSAGSAGPAAVA
jgi:hypothetical protein